MLSPLMKLPSSLQQMPVFLYLSQPVTLVQAPRLLGDPGTKPWLTTVGASTQSRFLQGTIILGNGAQYTGASITAGVGPAPLVDAASLGNALCNPAVAFTGSVVGKIVVCQRGVNARVAKSLAVFNAGGVGMIMHENSDAGNLFSDTHWVPSVHVDQTPGLAIKAYIAANPGTATAKIVAPADRRVALRTVHDGLQLARSQPGCPGYHQT